MCIRDRHLADGLLFIFPAGLHAVKLLPQLGQLLLHLRQMGKGQLIGLQMCIRDRLFPVDQCDPHRRGKAGFLHLR